MQHFPKATIHLGNLCHNLSIVRQHVGGSSLLAVVKANAYGHGVEACVNALSDSVEGFAVARIEEGLAVRKLCADIPVLVMGGIRSLEQVEIYAQHKLDTVIHSEAQIEILEEACQNNKAPTAIKLWLKMDSGMHRLGIPSSQYQQAYQRLSKLPVCKEVIAMTHFASADDTDSPFTLQQLNCFSSVLASVGSSLKTSMANSAAILHTPQSHGDWVRPGLMLYGINPSPAIEQDLKPVMTLQSSVMALNEITAGDTVGYNQTWQAKQKSLIATVAMGYGDGYPTTLKPNTPVLINGERAPIVGRVSMDLITVDCSQLKTINIGDTVTFWGEGLPVEEIAACAQTIPYDLVTKVTARVPREYCE